ncbi:MAG TPA: hypothetical protein VGR28_14815 [Candidatus Thermoplasmatota archaeon]|jgi:hypothetical protein|nr:hypothetical protein [Candidatus Thermoplasmatota archaeon]
MRILILTLALIAAAGVAAAAELPPLPPLPPIGGGAAPSVTCGGQLGVNVAISGGQPVVEISVPSCDVDPGL